MLQHLNTTKPRGNQRWLQGALCISVPITQNKDLQSPQALGWDPGDCSGHGTGCGVINLVTILIVIPLSVMREKRGNAFNSF